MFVVAYLSNYNGMALWCWEAAHALSEADQPVLLITSNEVELPGTSVIDVMQFNPKIGGHERRGLLAQTASELERLSQKSSGFLEQLHSHLQEQGITPSAYFLNPSNLQDPSIHVPQYVVGWAYPTSLVGYLSKIGKFTGWKPKKFYQQKQPTLTARDRLTP